VATKKVLFDKGRRRIAFCQFAASHVSISGGSAGRIGRLPVMLRTAHASSRIACCQLVIE
jgi:hypothetical protein